MNRWLKIGGIAILVVVVGVVMWGAVAFAQDAAAASRILPDFARGRMGRMMGEKMGAFAGPGRDDLRGGPGHGRGTHGEVTEVDEDSLTLLNRDGETVEVKLTDETKVFLGESRSEGSLSDIAVGQNVGVRARENDEGTLEALAIMILPEGDHLGGRVTGVDGSAISIENPDGSATINTSDETEFQVGRDESGSLADVAEGKFVGAFGELQDDDSLQARLVIIKERGRHGMGDGPPEGHAGGEVTGIDGSTLSLKAFWGDELTILTGDATQCHTCTDEEVSFEDIEVGQKIGVRGEPVEDQENTIQAADIFLAGEDCPGPGRPHPQK